MEGHRTSPCLWVLKDELFFSSTFKSICCIVLVWGEEYNSRVLKSFRECITAEDREVLNMCLRDNFDPQDHAEGLRMSQVSYILPNYFFE